jgi:hypothetical protein
VKLYSTEEHPEKLAEFNVVFSEATKQMMADQSPEDLQKA